MKSTSSGARWLALGVVLLAVLVASPVLAGERLTRGADLWETSTGLSYSSFKAEPIPADFFCPGSEPFTGVIQLNGKPLATAPAGALGNIDTIVHRLDDARLNEKGEASTRIQLMALSLASVKPIETRCGRYDVTSSLAGAQPMTTMRIRKTSDGGGTYIAPLELNVKLTFTPVSGQGASRELYHHVNMSPASGEVWSFVKPVLARTGTVRVDTDGDGVPDSEVPGPSNFRAGVAPVSTVTYVACPVCHCSTTSTDPNQSAAGCDHLHCTTVQMQGPCPAVNTLNSTE
ncbi:MAG TPA: hypothetical protein VFE33_15655 [Thermoanaerobaculia bacterium]|nr:hypothetical protein [Thermoanaerobaculia bacterium]